MEAANKPSSWPNKVSLMDRQIESMAKQTESMPALWDTLAFIQFELSIYEQALNFPIPVQYVSVTYYFN